MPIAIRPFEMSCIVAYQLAVIVGSRIPGFVTKCPSLIFVVCAAASGSVAYESCQRMCESYVQRVLEPVLLGELHQLDHPRVGRIGQNGDAERQRPWQGNDPNAPKSARTMAWLYLLFAFAAGAMLPFQFGINAQLAHLARQPDPRGVRLVPRRDDRAADRLGVRAQAAAFARAARRRAVVGLDRRIARRVLRHRLDRQRARSSAR